MRNIVASGLATTLVVSGCANLPVPPLTTREGRFLNFVQVLADSGQLTDRDEMARLLQTRLIKKPFAQIVRDPDECRRNPSTQRLYDINIYTVGEDFWFKRSGGDNPPNQVSGFATPMFTYSITYDQRCSEDATTPPHVSADMQFYDVPAFVCVSETNLVRLIPLAKFVPATDGATVYLAPSKDKKTYISIQFLFSGKCASVINIRKQ